MKYILIVAVGAVVGVGLVLTVGKEVTYEKEVVNETTTTTVEVDAIDVLEEAQQALDKANLLLDEEEARLLEQRGIIDARLEEIVKKRTSF